MLLAMHLPDHVLDPVTSALASVLAVAAIGWSLWAARREVWARRASLVPTVAAVVFAGQMVNYLLPGLETSGHLIGGALAAIIVGPAFAVLTLSLVLVVQGLIFGDGGLAALGANVLNMAVVAPLIGWAVYQQLARAGRLALAAVVASWASVMAAALVCGGQLAVSGQAPAANILGTMAFYHALIGLGEALLTGIAVYALAAWQPALLVSSDATQPTARPALGWWPGMALALAIALFASPWASQCEDGLERALAQLGMDEAAGNVWTLSPLPDYAVPLAHLHAAVSTALAGALGTLLVFGLAVALVRPYLGPACGSTAGSHP